MQSCVRFDESENCFIINNIIKIDNNKIEKIFNKRNLEDLLKLDDNLYYYKEKSLVEILFDISNYTKIEFKNNNSNDYRSDNILISKKEKKQINDPINVKILKRGKPKIITGGAMFGQEKNHYWKVKDNENNEYYIMHIIDDVYTKFSIEDKEKIFNFNYNRPTWYLHNTGYITSSINTQHNKFTLYMHQYIMNSHFENNSNMKKTVDHINRDKLDNRRENLRFASMTEQNLNKGKQKRQTNACPLPNGISQIDLPIHVCYNNRCYNKEKNSWREFFTIENHPKLDKCWATTKSNNVSIQDKLEQVKLKLKHLDGKISDKEYKKIVEPNFVLPKGLRLFIDKKYNKYKFEYDNRTPSIRLNYKMVLTHNDLQLMIDKFIDLLNEKYKDTEEYVKMSCYKLDKPVILDFSNVNNEIIEDEDEINNTEDEINNTTTENNDKLKIKKYNKKPDLPDNFSLYQEKEVWYLSFSKKIDTLRYNKKIKLNSMCIQTELDRLINIINTEFPNLKINQCTVQNPYDFIDNTQLKENNRPKLPSNFCITNINKVDYIQFSKKINDKKVCYKTNIKSYDLQKDLNNFVDNLNKKYNFNIPEQKIINMNDWKTTNKIILNTI
jgi:hypothetical protein